MSPLVFQAAAFAAKAHAGQVRKGDLAAPFIVHPLEVAELVASTHINAPFVLMAALLHDVVEDCGVPLDRIESLFGGQVRDVVAALSFPKEASKADKIARAPSFNAAAAMIKKADLISNLRGIAKDASALSPEGRKRYVDYAIAMAAALDQAEYPPSALDHEFISALGQVKLFYGFN